MAIAASFLASYQQGLSTSLAILIHEVPHEVGDYAILLQSGWSTTDAIRAQYKTALAAFLGVFVVLVLGGENGYSHHLLPFTAGGFIYIAMVSVLPSLMADTSFKQTVWEVLAMVLGVALMVGIVFLE